MKRHSLVLEQQDDKYGSCKCILNGKHVDGCDMNFEERYTQAHVVLASAWRTFRTKDLNIIITGEAKVGQYPLDKLIAMADNLIDDKFEDLYGYTRVYSGARD